MAKSSKKSRQVKSSNPDIYFRNLGLCHDLKCDKYSESERAHGIKELHRHAWVVHRGLSSAELVAAAEECFGGSCIDITQGLKA